MAPKRACWWKRNEILRGAQDGGKERHWSGALPAKTRRRARPLLGTFVEISASGCDGVRLDAAIDRAFEAVATVHRLMSFQEPGSELSRLNRGEPSAGFHPWTKEVLAM